MVNISKQTEDSIKFVFENSQHYLIGNGEISVPLNSLQLVIDSSDMVTFKKLDGDPFVSFNIDESNFASKDALVEFYETEMVGGGGIPTEEIQEMIDESIAPIKAETVTDAEYISSAHTINLYNISGTVLSSIDATDFIKDGMVSNVEVKDVEISGETIPCLAITFNTDAGHQEIDIPLSEFFDSTQYYTKSETDALLSGKANSSDVYTRTASNYRYMSGASITSGATYDRLYMNKGDGMTNTVAAYFGKINGLPIATKNSSAVNNFTLTEESAFTAFSASTEAALSGKQDTLIAGDNIKIDDDTISVYRYHCDEKTVCGGAPYECQEEYEVIGDEYLKIAKVYDGKFVVSLIDENEDYVYKISAYYDYNVGSWVADSGESTSNWANYVYFDIDPDDNSIPHNLLLKKNPNFEDELWANNIYSSGYSVIWVSCFTDTLDNTLDNFEETINNLGENKQDLLTAGSGINIVDNVISADVTIDPSLDSGSTNAVANSAITNAINAKADKGVFTAITKTSLNGHPAAKFNKDTGGFELLWYSRINGTDILNTGNTPNNDFSLVETSAFTAFSASTEAALSGKQDTLIAGSGITISGNVISADGGSITIDPSLDSGSTNAVANSAITTAINSKQNAMDYFVITGYSPTVSTGSSSGINYTALTIDRINPKTRGRNTGIYYLPFINGKSIFRDMNARPLYDEFNLVETSAVTTTISSASTDTEIPSAKAVYDAIPQGASYSAGTNISIDTANTISCTLPISGGSNYSIVGTNCATNGFASVAMGTNCNVKGQGSVAIGDSCEAGTTNYSNGAAAFGYYTSAKGYYAFAAGNRTQCTNSSEAALGNNNKSVHASNTFGDSGNTLFSVGNGTSNSARHNAFEIRQNGDIYISSGGTDIKLQDNLGGGGIDSGTVQTMIDASISGKVNTSAITSSITSASTDTEIPSAKAVYDAIGEGGGGLDEDFLQANANALYELKQEGKATNERFDNYYTKTASDGRYASNASIKKAYYDKAYVDDKLLAISASLNELNANSGRGGGLSEDTEKLIASALVDLNDTKADISDIKANYQRKGDYATKTELAAKANASEVMTLEKAKENELVTAKALNSINERLIALEAAIQALQQLNQNN